MNDRKHPTAECLDAETLAEYLDGAVHPARSRDLVEAHLAECEDCYELFAESVRTRAELRSLESPLQTATAARVTRFPARRRLLTALTAGLAAAAALLVFVGPSDTLVRWLHPERRPELRQVVAAVGTHRAIDGRLSGGFAWGPLPTVTRGEAMASSNTPEVRIATAMLSEQAQRSRTPAALSALGTAQLASGQIDPAIASLEEALRLDASNAFAWSDLAAGYVARSRFGAPEDLGRAVEAADRAIVLHGTLPEARFNKALALQHLARRREAIDAWRAYLERDGSSPWAAEARRRLAELENGPGPS